MTGSHRLLPYLLVLALVAGTGCTAIGYSLNSGVPEDGTARAGTTHEGLGFGESLQSPAAAQVADTTAGVRDSSVATSPAPDSADSKRGMNSTLVVITVLAVVAGLIFLVAR